MQIRGKVIGPGKPCFIIAECGANHDGLLDRAMALVEAAHDAGADAVKLQLYRASSLYSQRSAPGEWQVIRDHEVPYEWLKPLSDYAHDLGMAFICSVFDAETLTEAARWCDAIKIASSDANDPVLLRYAVMTDRPIIISLGTLSLTECKEMCQVLYRFQTDYATLVCNAVYPSGVVDVPLLRIPDADGLSDHTLSTWLPAVAVGMGAHVIEKHLTLMRGGEGPDHAHSLTSGEFSEMVQNIRDVEAAMKLSLTGPTPSEIAANAMWYKRSIHAARDIQKGRVVAAEDLIVQRPYDGLPPDKLHEVIGQKAARDYEKGEGVIL